VKHGPHSNARLQDNLATLKETPPNHEGETSWLISMVL
jgi:hypothetical protein